MGRHLSARSALSLIAMTLCVIAASIACSPQSTAPSSSRAPHATDLRVESEDTPRAGEDLTAEASTVEAAPPVSEGARITAGALTRAALRVTSVASAFEGRVTVTSPPLPEGYLSFSRACEAGTRITIAAVGDIIIHEQLALQALKAPTRYRSLWRGIEDLLQRADLTYGNLEGACAPGVSNRHEVADDPGFAFDGHVYSGYPQFNYHPFLLEDLVTAGFDLVSTANNHSMDRGALGVDRTLDELARAGLPGFGTRRSDAPDEAPWHVVTEAKGIRVAWVACTKHTNRKETFGQVQPCYQALGPDRPEPNVELLARVTSLAADPAVDAVIVTPHFGKSYKPRPNVGQTTFARAALEAGAIAVLGSHTHNLQPWERHVTSDGREGFIMYSMGNFISGQGGAPKRSTVLIYLGLTRRVRDGVVALHGVRFVPLYMDRQPDGLRVEAVDRCDPARYTWVRQGIERVIGALNVLPSSEPLTLNPHCDSDWRASVEAGD